MQFATQTPKNFLPGTMRRRRTARRRLESSCETKKQSSCRCPCHPYHGSWSSSGLSTLLSAQGWTLEYQAGRIVKVSIRHMKFTGDKGECARACLIVVFFTQGFIRQDSCGLRSQPANSHSRRTSCVTSFLHLRRPVSLNVRHIVRPAAHSRLHVLITLLSAQCPCSLPRQLFL